MEVTKWLKPSISVSRIGDSASVQAVTRVNVEQTLYGAFEVKHTFCTTLHFLHSSFFVGRGEDQRELCHRARIIAPQPCIR